MAITWTLDAPDADGATAYTIEAVVPQCPTDHVPSARVLFQAVDGGRAGEVQQADVMWGTLDDAMPPAMVPGSVPAEVVSAVAAMVSLALAGALPPGTEG